MEINKNLILKLIGNMKSNYETPEAPGWMLDLVEITSDRPDIIEVVVERDPLDNNIVLSTSLIAKAPGVAKITAKKVDKSVDISVTVSTENISNARTILSRLMLNKFYVQLQKGRLININELNS